MFINNFDPVAIQIFSIEIRWYSLAYITGILAGWILSKKIIISDVKLKEKFDDYLTYLIIGIIFGGSGQGEAMAANKIKGIRCALCWSENTARLAKEHNDANVISIGERQISKDLALKIVDIWLNSTFEGGRHTKRIKMLDSNN